MEDSKIILLYFNRSDLAIPETEKKYGAYCYRIAYNILANREDSEECVNDTYLAAWKQIPPTKPNVLSVFLGKITRNIAVSRWRSGQTLKRGKSQITKAVEELERTLSSGFDLEEHILNLELKQVLRDFLFSLKETERRVFLCRYWYMDSIGDIASQFGFSHSKVKSMLMRTRNKLKRYLLEKGGFDHEGY